MMENGHVLRLQTKWFNAVRNGSKQIEGRLLKEKLMHIRVGDVISFECNEDKQHFTIRKVTRLCIYNTLHDMITSENLCDLLPGIESYGEAIKIYQQIYTQHQLATHKLLAIHFSV